MTTLTRLLPARRVLLPVVLAMVVLVVAPGSARASNDPLFAQQWNLARIGAPAAWATTTGTGVKVGIVDTGVDLTHEDLAGQVLASTNCVGAKGDPAKCTGSGQDDQGHGTHVAGIVAAVKDNGVGVAGVAPGAQLLVAKALTAEGAGAPEDVNAGIRWVVDQGARVVNLSLGDDFLVTTLLGSSLADGINYAWSKGAVPVVAAGNTNLLGLGLGSSQYGTLPALVVGAVGPDNRVASYSSPTGDARWAVLAPGGAGGTNDAVNVLSTWWDEDGELKYEALAGTSMATPHVAGAVALLLATGRTPQQAVDRILSTTAPAASCGGLLVFRCAGRLDVAAAVAPGNTPAPPPPPRGLLGLGILGL